MRYLDTSKFGTIALPFGGSTAVLSALLWLLLGAGDCKSYAAYYYCFTHLCTPSEGPSRGVELGPTE